MLPEDDIVLKVIDFCLVLRDGKEVIKADCILSILVIYCFTTLKGVCGDAAALEIVKYFFGYLENFDENSVYNQRFI